jgi:uncharacterized membrane protein YccC
VTDVPTELPGLVSPADDPRARAGIRRAKAWCGIVGFVIAAYAAYGHNPAFTVCVHALVGGIVGNLVGWAAALAVWRRIMRAETRQKVDELRERAAARAAALSSAETAIITPES